MGLGVKPWIARSLEGLALAALLGLISVYALRLLWDIDVFWHVVAGQLLVKEGLSVARDTFSAIDPDRPWVPLVWGYHMLTYGLDRLGGLQALRLFHAALQVFAFGLFYWTCRRRLGMSALGSLAMVALLAVLYADRFRARPHVFNLNFEILLLPWLVGGPAALDRRSMVAVAIIFALWANIHGGGAFVMLVALAALPAAATVDAWLRVPGREHHAQRAWAWFAAAAVPALISPLFVRSVIHTFGMVNASEEYTFEWHPSWRLFFAGYLPAHYFAAAFPTLLVIAAAFPLAKLVTLAQRGGLRRALAEYPLHPFLLLAAFGYLTHRSLRFIYMAAFAFLILKPLLQKALGELELRPRARAAIVGALALALVAMGYQSRITQLYGSLPRALEVVTGPTPLQEARFPVAQADYLERTGFEGRIFCQAMWGGYLLYRLWPHVLVLADGRGNHDDELTRELRTLGNRTNMRDPQLGPEIQAIYEKYPVDVIVHHHPVWPEGYQPRGWVPVQADAIGAIWVRAQGAGTTYLERLVELGELEKRPVPAP